MKKITYFFITIFICTKISAQIPSVDFVLYEDSKKVEYRLKEYMDAIMKDREGKNTCTKFNYANSIQTATSDYIFELWEFEESLKTGIFREKRSATKTDAKGQNYQVEVLAAGVQVKAMSYFLGRLYERSTGEVINVFAINGDNIKEIADDEVKNKYRIGESNKVLEDAMLIKHEAGIIALRKEIYNDYFLTLQKAIHNSFDKLLPPASIGKIKEQKEDKLKDVFYNECYEKPLNYDWFYCDLFTDQKIGDKNLPVKVGSSYVTSSRKGNVGPYLGIRDGEKELLPIVKSGAKIYAMDNPENEYYFVTPSSFQKKSYDFIFHFPPDLLYNFTPAQKTYIELLFQSHFLKFKDSKVLANTSTADQLKWDSDKEKAKSDINVDEFIKNNHIWVTITHPNAKPQKNGNTEVKYSVGSKEVIDNFSIVISSFGGKDLISNESLELKNIDKEIFLNEGKIYGLVNLPKEKDQYVLVESKFPFSNVKEFEVYDTENITPKTKPVGKLKKEKIFNPFLAACEIDEGKKELLPGIPANKKYYLKGKEQKALFGLVSDSPTLTYIPYYKFR